MYKRFNNFTETLLNSKLTYVIIILIGFTAGFLMCYFDFDTTPATAEDYAPLLEIQDDILDNFNNVYHYDNTDIDLVQNNIIVSVSNDECSINIFFDENMNYLYTEKKDNIDFSETIVIFLSIAAAIAFIAILLFCFVVILFILDAIIFIIDNKKSTTTIDNDIDH